MFIKDLVLCLQITANQNSPKQASDCYLNPPCGCANPGKEIACESCEYLEGCLSRYQHQRIVGTRS
jgi:hypothetical protein